MTSPRGLAAIALLVAAGCNALFGVSDLRFDGDGEDGGSGSGTGGAGGSGQGASTTGAGGAGGSAPMKCMPGTTEACYDGPTETQDVGACHGGERTCSADGMAFGACVGQVLPSEESCTTPSDES